MNKKRHLSLLLMICVILLFGCAGKEKEADPWEDENYFETRVEEQEEQEKERKAKEAVAAASDGSWFMDHGLKFTSTGKGYVYDAALIKDKVDELPYFDNGHTYRYFALGEKGTPSMGEKVVQDAIDAYNGDNEDKGLEWGEGSSPWNHLPESNEQED